MIDGGRAAGGEIRVNVTREAPGGWDDLTAADPAADFFHTATWLQAACRGNPGLQPVWLLATDRGRILAGLAALRRTHRLPLLGETRHLESSLEGTSGGPLVRGDLPSEERQRLFLLLLEAFLELRTGLLAGCSVSLNTFHEREFGRLLRPDPRWVRREVPGAVIDLSEGLEKVEMGKLTNNKRNERNRGLKRGARVFATCEAGYLEQYYPLYEAAAAHWGTPAVPLDFLRALMAAGPGQAFFTCVTLEDRVIGGHLNLVHGGQVIAWNGVTDPAFARTHFPGSLVVWGDIVEACRRGARSLDLGASGGVHSLAGFKKHFGAHLESRGFYVNQTAGLKVLRGMRSGKERLGAFLGRPGPARRWHDGRTGQAQSGGPAGGARRS